MRTMQAENIAMIQSADKAILHIHKKEERPKLEQILLNLWLKTKLNLVLDLFTLKTLNIFSETERTHFLEDLISEKATLIEKFNWDSGGRDIPSEFLELICDLKVLITNLVDLELLSKISIIKLCEKLHESVLADLDL